jgi:translation initiation factor 3 subunit D
MSFVLPEIHDSPLGFGPSDGGLNQFKEVPFAPFSKSEKLGKAADWTSTTRQFQSMNTRNFPYVAN